MALGRGNLLRFKLNSNLNSNLNRPGARRRREGSRRAWRTSAFDTPLVQNGRAVDAALEEIEGPRAALAPLEQLLRCAHADAGEAIADALWSSYSVADAVAAVTALATPENLAAWEQPDAEARDEDEGHSSSPGKKRGGGRNS